MKSKKKFSLEISLIEKALDEQFNIIAEKPHFNDFDEIKLWVDNTFMRANRTVSFLKDVKSSLEAKENDNEISETYNSPA
jgi:hypothetical protein